MELIYLGHSGMLIKSGAVNMIFDYWTGKRPWDDEPPLATVQPQIDMDKPLYVFISHSHGDHFSREAIAIYQAHPGAVCIASREVASKTCHTRGILYVSPGDIYEDEHIRLQVYGSTDEGVSFYIEHDGKRIFHAGDLNDWHWRDHPDTQEEYARNATAMFLQEVEVIAAGVSELDLLMFPLDPRLESGLCTGPAAFLAAVPTAVYAPMHLWDVYEAIDAFAAHHGKACGHIIRWTAPGDAARF